MATPTFNKYKSTTIYGNLSVRDLTNSSGSSVIEVASIDLSGNFLSRGDSTFTKAVVCNASVGDINANNKLATKEYVDNAVSTGGSVSLSGTNNFTGFNTYNTNFPTSTLVSATAITDDSIVNKRKNDTLYSSITNEVKTNTANAFTSTNSFNSNFPTSTLDTSTAITDDSIVNKGMNDTLYGSLTNNATFLGEIIFDGTTNTINGTTTNLYGTTTNITGTTNISGDTDFSGTNNKFTSIQVDDTGDPAPLTLSNGAYITQTGTATNTLSNLTLSNGVLTQTGTEINTMANLQVKTIATEPIIATQISENYSSVKMRNYVFHSRTTTTASGITLSTDANIDDGQYLYVRKINSGIYTLTLTRGGTTTFLNLSNASVNTIALTGLTGVSFVYDKTNTRWIQLT